MAYLISVFSVYTKLETVSFFKTFTNSYRRKSYLQTFLYKPKWYKILNLISIKTYFYLKLICQNRAYCFYVIAAEKKALKTYDYLIDLTCDPDVLKPLRFLREREIVHFQRFGEALDIVRDYLNESRVFDMPNNPLKRGMQN